MSLIKALCINVTFVEMNKILQKCIPKYNPELGMYDQHMSDNLSLVLIIIQKQ